MKVYFDTNIIDAVFTLFKWEGGEKDKRYSESKKFDLEKNLIALRYLLDIGEEQWGMTFGTSNFTRREIERIKQEKDPEYYKQKLPDLYTTYQLLREISAKEFERDKRAHRLTINEELMLKQRISRLVTDPDDVEHLTLFKTASWDVFLTLDWKHMLRPETRELLNDLGIDIHSPLSLVETFIEFDTLIRTLHGSWETRPILSRPK